MTDALVFDATGRPQIGDRVSIKEEHRGEYSGKRTTKIGDKDVDFTELNLRVLRADPGYFYLGMIYGDPEPVCVDRLHVDRVNRDSDGW